MDNLPMDTYLDDEKALEGIKAFKKYLKKQEAEQKSSGNGDGAEKKETKKLFNENHENDRFLLQVDFKRVPLNHTTWNNVIGPLPHSWFSPITSNVCLIVKDVNKEKLGDRELDLRQTREHYENMLIEAGFGQDFLKQCLYIMPARELFTEYTVHQAKGRLVVAYDRFIVESGLMNNKFKQLNRHLGTKFWVKCKKIPTPLTLVPEQLKERLMNLLQTTNLTITGNGACSAIQFGVYSQPDSHLLKNLLVVLRQLHTLYGNSVRLLSIKLPESCSIPIFADLGPRYLIDVKARALVYRKEQETIREDFPLFNHADIEVKSGGRVMIKRRPKASDAESEDEDEDDLIDILEEKWEKITHPARKRSKALIKGLRRARPEADEEALVAE